MDKNEIRKTEHMYSTIQIGETVFSQFEKNFLRNNYPRKTEASYHNCNSSTSSFRKMRPRRWWMCSRVSRI